MGIRLLGPKIGNVALSIFLWGTGTSCYIESFEPRFCNLSITSLALYKLSYAATSVQNEEKI